MRLRHAYIKSIVAALAATVTFSLPASAQGADPARVADLLQQLQDATPADADRIARQIRDEWSKSGSPAMDLLLKRGNDALEVGDLDTAIEHFTALTDHAPDFAEGWHGLALTYYRKELFGVTIWALERTLTLNPQHFGAMRGLAAVLEQVDRPDDAYEVYSRVLDMHPNDADVKEAIDRLESRVTGRTL